MLMSGMGVRMEETKGRRFTETGMVGLCALIWLLSWSSSTTNAEDIKSSIGSKIDSIRFKDIRGVPRELSEFGKHRAYVFVFVTSDCPIVRKTLPKLSQLYREYQAKDVFFVSVNVGLNDTLRDMASQAIEFQAPWAFVKDYDAQVAKILGVTRTPEVAVLDSEHRLVYRGRVDDQFRLGGSKPDPSRDDLKEAIEDLLAERPVRVAQTSVDGCAIPSDVSDATPLESKLNYHEHIAPILHGSCTSCHRPGTAAPFSLMTHQDVLAHAEMIREVIRDETMPPWYAHKDHGKFQNDRSLSDKQKEVFLEWLSSKRAIGPEDATREIPQFDDTPWRIGTPDLIITTLEQHTVPATGFVPYKYVVLPHVFLSDTWVPLRFDH